MEVEKSSGNRGGGSRFFSSCRPLSRSFPQCPNAVEEPSPPRRRQKAGLGPGPGPGLQGRKAVVSMPAAPPTRIGPGRFSSRSDTGRRPFVSRLGRGRTSGGIASPRMCGARTFPSVLPDSEKEGLLSQPPGIRWGRRGLRSLLVRSPANSNRRSALKGFIKPNPCPGTPEARKMD